MELAGGPQEVVQDQPYHVGHKAHLRFPGALSSAKVRGKHMATLPAH